MLQEEWRPPTPPTTIDSEHESSKWTRNFTISRKETHQPRRPRPAPRTKGRALALIIQSTSSPRRSEKNIQRETSVSNATRRDTHPRTASQTGWSTQNTRKRRHKY